MQNVTGGIVGKDHAFTVFENNRVDSFLSSIEGEERRGGQAAPAEEEPAAAEGEERMDE